eukprot:TRINITY_DN8923_c0_g1::TRINITY_DN8923_c0_g1_i1::g.24719::m.24719 TRINITY_DN8923_c0_g1::TRINITY_DN8923_c0_g1_i1::g.24719  ORF type:complete len:133 (+),score=11.80,sp/Q8T9S7/PTEN_DICDI/52.31/6e-44,Y_phosphatase3/PF13350.1/1.5e-05,DSPc/PF00782.15/0.00021,Y_phosphatase/PF00102.22/0.0016,PTPlike_phytase/PF14566.1/0.0025,CDKN3/PF05706.7/0.0057,Y_phosphatase2/PF03162.8/0.0084 TRINITY_DN8923_c0_g1_i1:305-703(+)
MGFPSSGVEGAFYRNPLPEVLRFLEIRHGDFWKVYNLCSEREYPASKFLGRVARFPFDDHCPPPMDLMRAFCEDAAAFLTADPRHVVAVHCKAGKGRTGLMVSCLLLHLGHFHSARDALRWYSLARTLDQVV